MSKLEIVYKNINDLEEYDNNPRNNEEAIQYVANSISQFGFKVPIVIGTDNVIVCGHTRLQASKRLGLTEVPCVVADDLTDKQIRAFRLADNKVSEFAEWDIEKLDIEIATLDFDMKDFGFEFALDDKEEESIPAPVEQQQCIVVKCDDVEDMFRKFIQAGYDAYIINVDKKIQKVFDGD